MTGNQDFAFSANRRSFLRLGLGGFTSLGLPGMLRLRANVEPVEKTAIILVWLRGGPSHLETFDPKPDAPSDYRGPYKAIATKTPGMMISELFPRLAGISDRFALLRSIAHNGGGHPAGSLQMLSGDPDAPDKPGPKYPDWMSVANYFRSGEMHSLPHYVAVNPIDNYDNFVIAGPTYLGTAFDGFKVFGDPSNPQFQVPNVGLRDRVKHQQLTDRVNLARSFDRFRDTVDKSQGSSSLNRFESQAMAMLTSADARIAFDLSLEPIRVRDAMDSMPGDNNV